jgi:large subunit ribosomal protein L6
MKRYTINIPSDIVILYSSEKRALIVKGPVAQKSFLLEVKILVMDKAKIILVTPIPFVASSNYKKKKMKSMRGTTIALIKQLIVETSAILYQKLKFVGVGYRAFNVDSYKPLLLFKLGYSHPIYYKIPYSLNFYNLKFTRLFISGNSTNVIEQAAAIVRSFKNPEPYKGKGVLYETEKIKLKEGKKT